MSKAKKRELNPIGRTEENPLGIQHDPVDYYSANYLSRERMSSYSYQYSLALETGGQSFLNIGSANSVLKFLMKKKGLEVIDLDLDWNTKPDLTTALPFLPFNDKSFDVVMCFQMLEHLPLTMFSISLVEMKRIAKQFILLSLPDQTISKNQAFKYLIYNFLKRPVEWGIYKKYSMDIEHFWEIGHSDISENMIIEFIRKENLEIIKHFRNERNRYHHFFLLKV